METIGNPELAIILVIVILLFGIGRIGKIGGELGSGIRAFREGLRGDEPAQEQKDETTENFLPAEENSATTSTDDNLAQEDAKADPEDREDAPAENS